MADDQSILTQSLRSNLCDRSYEKRKLAAMEIEIHVRNLRLHFPVTASPPLGPSSGPAASDAGLIAAQSREQVQVAKLIESLVQDFCKNAFPLRRQGGLTALASAAIALEHHAVQAYVSQIVPAVLTCFSDQEKSVRYSACETFYNIAKVARSGILAHQEEVFDGLCRLYSDFEQEMKQGAQCLDRLVKDIVTECPHFDYSAFIPLLTRRIRVLNPSIRQLVLGWIILLDSIPQVDMIACLSQYLEGLFGILTSEDRAIRHSTNGCLDELLQEIRDSVNDRPARAQRAIAEAAPTVAKCCQAGDRCSEDTSVRLKALHWLLEFVKLQIDLESFDAISSAQAEMRSGPHTNGRLAFSTCATSSGFTGFGGTIIVSSGAGTIGSAGSGGLRQLVPTLLVGALHCLDDVEEEIRKIAEQANRVLREAALHLRRDLPVEAIMDAVLGAMREQVQGKDRSPDVLLKCLGWVQLLLTLRPDRVLQPGVLAEVLDAVLPEAKPDPSSDSYVTVSCHPHPLAKLPAAGAAGDVGVIGRYRCERCACSFDRSMVRWSCAQCKYDLCQKCVEQSGEEHKLLLMSPGDRGDEVAKAALQLLANLVAAGDGVRSGTQLVGHGESEFFRRTTEEDSGVSGTPSQSPGESPQESPQGSVDGDETQRALNADDGGGSTGDLFARICHRLFRAMAVHEDLLRSRGELVVRKLCDGVDAERFFATAARAITEEQDRVFAPRLVRVLNRVLLTARETRVLRAQLRDDATARSTELRYGRVDLLELLQSWFHCPVSSLALCLWLHWFELAAELTPRLAAMELTKDLQDQLAFLVELLESPIFMRVRLHLLESRRRPALLRAMLGLIALLPEDHALRARLDVVKTGLLLDRLGWASSPPPQARAPSRPAPPGAAQLLQRFDETVEAHRWCDCIV